MRRHLLLLATALAAGVPMLASQGHAETVTGPYVSLGAGYNIRQDDFLHTDPAISGIP